MDNIHLGFFCCVFLPIGDRICHPYLTHKSTRLSSANTGWPKSHDTVTKKIEYLPYLSAKEADFFINGAPPHYGKVVRDYLDDTFVHWIGRRGTTEWPPRSPDLTPCDFSLWGIIKDRVYTQNPRSVNDMKALIKEEFRSVNDDIKLCQSICRSVASRCQMCTDTEGKQFEHLL
ncbi:unnamed protein product [Adineta ricciae]|uniref:Uncharacterized protein n=1 Tax=Adineta ricciae TaxID=249248 RepID=A0A815UIQ0_ADIRI|nr:unnamed protein product [Adineta ricciae]CAF1519712.1 unnamed protein product [Adineta ricciae]